MPKTAPKLLLISDAPGNPTGLGGQSQLVYEAAVQAGFQTVAANLVIQPHEFPPRFFHAGGMIPEYLVDTPLPPDHLGYMLEDLKPDHVVALCDAWMLGAYPLFPASLLAKTTLWTTADHEFFPESHRRLYERIHHLVFMADFGARWWGDAAGLTGNRKKSSLKTSTIWHAVDGSLFKPRPPGFFDSQKKALGVYGRFIALHVGRNQHRKQQPLLIEAWARFVRALPKAEREKVLLYLHTEERSAPVLPVHGDLGINAMSVLFSGLDLSNFIRKNYEPEVASAIRFSERGVPKEGVALMYALSDVHVLTSTGEGFGVPLIEAQATGIANIAADNTTTPEIVGGATTIWNNGRVGVAEGEDSAADFDGSPFGWRVPCESFTVQPDFSGKRPQVSIERLASALADAYGLWRRGVLNRPSTVSRRRTWTLNRYGWERIKSQWTTVLKDTYKELT